MDLIISKELRRKLISTTIAFIIFVVFCIISAAVAKVNTEKPKNSQETNVEDLYDY